MTITKRCLLLLQIYFILQVICPEKENITLPPSHLIWNLWWSGDILIDFVWVMTVLPALHGLKLLTWNGWTSTLIQRKGCWAERKCPLPHISENLRRFNLFNTTPNVGLPRWLSGWKFCLQFRRQRRCRFDLDWEDPLQESMATPSSILAWRILWAEMPGGLQSIGSQRVRRYWAHMHAYLIWSGCGLNLNKNNPCKHGFSQSVIKIQIKFDFITYYLVMFSLGSRLFLK